MSASDAAVSFGVATPIAFGPSIALLAAVVWKRIKSRTEVVDASEESLTQRLRASKKSAAQRRFHVSFVLLQVGWLLFCYGLTPFLFGAFTSNSLNDVIGATMAWLAVAPIGLFLGGMSILPTDTIRLRALAFVGFPSFLLLGLLSASWVPETFRDSRPLHRWFVPITFIAWSVLFFASAVFTARLLPWRGRFAVPTRQVLRRGWLIVRVDAAFLAVTGAAIQAADHAASHRAYDADAIGASIFCVVCVVCSLIATPANRGRVQRRLGKLGGSGGSEADEAAAVAAMCGSGDPAKLLANAVELFLCIPVSSMCAADLADSGLVGPSATPGARPAATTAEELAAKSKKAALGEVDAFFSHSWRDEDEAPGAKYAALIAWAARLDVEDPTIWLDKACIDQNNVDRALACLPVYLAGCKSLLVVAGSSYCSRLWCGPPLPPHHAPALPPHTYPGGYALTLLSRPKVCHGGLHLPQDDGVFSFGPVAARG